MGLGVGAKGTGEARKAALLETLRSALPLSGHLFIFFSKRCDRVRIVYWDRNGYAMWTKRLLSVRGTLASAERSEVGRVAT